MAIPPTYNLPGVPDAAIADPASGVLSPVWRSFFTLLGRLTSTTSGMLGVSLSNVPAATVGFPLLPNAANDAAAAAAGVQVGCFYRTANSVQQRLV